MLALCLSIGGYVYAKRALRDLKARALAREQVLTAFSFPELEEFDDVESPTMQRLPSTRLLSKKQQVEMSSRGMNGRGFAEGPDSEGKLSRQSSADGLLASERGDLELHMSDGRGGKDRATADSETRLVADCSGHHSDEESDR